MANVNPGGSRSTNTSVGRVYVWIPDADAPLGGRLRPEVVPLPRLLSPGTPGARLSGTFVEVHNAGALNAAEADGTTTHHALGDAQPGADGAFLFEPGRGGGRVDKPDDPGAGIRARSVAAA